MSLSVVAGRSHSGFRAAVYGIHFDPWGFDTLLYFVKMVAVFCFNGCREFAFFVYAKELPAEDCPTLTFFLLRGSILRLRRAPSPRDYSLRAISLSLSHRCVDPSSAFGAALLQGPTQLACWTFSCPMRQFLNAFPLREGGGQRPGWMCLIEAQICAADSSFSFYGLLISRPTDSRIHPAPLARPFSKGLLARDYLTWAFIPPTAYYLPSLFTKSS